jgi:hypothetical protein
MDQLTSMELSRMRVHLKLLTMLSIIAIAGIGPILEAHASPSTDAHQAHEAYTSAINSNNLQSLMAMFTDDIVFLSPNEPVVVGKTAVRAWCAAPDLLNER